MTSSLHRDYDHLFKVLCIGDSSVGKSSLVARYTEDSFEKRFISTIGVDFKIKTIDHRSGKSVKLQIWDTAGQERFRAITTTYYRGADGVLIVYDVTNPESIENISTVWIKQVQQYAARAPKIILVGNKSDLKASLTAAERERIDYLAREMRERLGGECVVKLIETSAKNGSNVDHAFADMVDEMIDAIRCKLAEAQLKKQGEKVGAFNRGMSLLKLRDDHCEKSWCCGLM